MQEGQIWTQIPGFDYFVSNNGQVRNNNGNIRPDDRGKVRLVDNLGRTRYFSVAKLVAEAFVQNPEGYRTIDHINRDRTDNSSDNLRWVNERINV